MAKSLLRSRCGGKAASRRKDVRDWVREKLSGHLVPKYVFWVEDFPKTLRIRFRSLSLQELGVQMIRKAKACSSCLIIVARLALGARGGCDSLRCIHHAVCSEDLAHASDCLIGCLVGGRM